jgi:phosphoribosylformylglycinamidine synthase I
MKPLFIIVAGDGINCERETAAALIQAGGDSKIVHINDLLENPKMLETAEGLAIPGGFSFGDELGSGQIMALKIRHKLGSAFFDMIEKKKPVIGICNGFQVLVKLGLLPFPAETERRVALAANESGKFIDRWVSLEVNPKSVCLWTKDLPLSTLELPIRHGEGRIVFRTGEEEALYQTLVKQGQIPLTYTVDVNGSYGRIAALTDPSGVVLGLMPHPEAFVSRTTYRASQLDAKGDGLFIFENIVKYLGGRKKDGDHGRKYA